MAYNKEKEKAWKQTPEGKASIAKWNRSPKGKAAQTSFAHSPTGKVAIKKWRTSPAGKANSKAYNQSPKGKATIARAKAKRERNLGFDPLNEPFIGSEGHHIDKLHIIFIPKELHRSVWHSLEKPETMEQINTKVICWLLGVG